MHNLGICSGIVYLQGGVVRAIAEYKEQNRAVNCVNDEPQFFERVSESVVDYFRQCSVDSDRDVDEPVGSFESLKKAQSEFSWISYMNKQ